MTTPFPIIPPTAVPFYVEDSYSLMVQPGNPWVFDPGVVNTDGTFAAGQTLTVWLISGELCLVPSPNSGAGFNLDTMMEIYDVSSPPARPTGTLLNFTPPYGTAPSAPLISVSCSDTVQPVARKRWGRKSPLAISAMAPSTGGPFLIGPRFQFNSSLASQWRCEYFYHLHGAWQAI